MVGLAKLWNKKVVKLAIFPVLKVEKSTETKVTKYKIKEVKMRNINRQIGILRQFPARDFDISKNVQFFYAPKEYETPNFIDIGIFVETRVTS